MVFNLMLKFFRSPLWLWLSHVVVERIPTESFFMLLVLLACLAPESHGYRLWIFSFYAIIIGIGSIIGRSRKKAVEPMHVKFDEIISVNYHATEYRDGTGLPCVRAVISYPNSRGKKDECEFCIFTYLDFEQRFADPKNAVRQILTSIPCVKSERGECSCWAIPNKYRTEWGIVKLA